jgi:hypothetical protein
MFAPQAVFQQAQSPAMWLFSAERLRNAAETILTDQLEQEVPYFRAVDAASEAAQRALVSNPDKPAMAEIQCEPPNYLPARVLYAFSMENALKGLAIARKPELVGAQNVDRALLSHDLNRLSTLASFTLAVQEAPILRALSHIGEWAGRYPVARNINQHIASNRVHRDPNELLDWGSQHPIMRGCCARMIDDLKTALPSSPSHFGVIVALPPRLE